MSRLHRRRFSRAGVSPGLGRSPTDTSAPAAAPHPPSPPNRSPASRPAPRAAPPPRLTPACPYTTGPRRRLMLPSASASRGGRPCGRGGWEEEKRRLRRRWESSAGTSPSLHHPHRPPQSRRGRPHAAAPQPLAHGPQHCRAPPRILLPPLSAEERLPYFRCACARSEVRKTPSSPSASRRLSLPPFFCFFFFGASIQVSPPQPDPEASAAASSSSRGGGNHRSGGRLREERGEAARDGTTQARTPLRDRSVSQSAGSRREGGQVPRTSPGGDTAGSAQPSLWPLEHGDSATSSPWPPPTAAARRAG